MDIRLILSMAKVFKITLKKFYFSNIKPIVVNVAANSILLAAIMGLIFALVSMLLLLKKNCIKN